MISIEANVKAAGLDVSVMVGGHATAGELQNATDNRRTRLRSHVGVVVRGQSDGPRVICR